MTRKEGTDQSTIKSCTIRIMMTDMGSFVLFNVYFPKGGKGPERIKFKLDFYRAFQTKIEELVNAGRNVVFVGDVNTAHCHIDTHNPQVKRGWLQFNP